MQSINKMNLSENFLRLSIGSETVEFCCIDNRLISDRVWNQKQAAVHYFNLKICEFQMFVSKLEKFKAIAEEQDWQGLYVESKS